MATFALVSAEILNSSGKNRRFAPKPAYSGT